MAVPTPVTTALALALGCLSLIGGNVTLANTSLDLSKVELHQSSTPAPTSAAPEAPAPAPDQAQTTSAAPVSTGTQAKTAAQVSAVTQVSAATQTSTETSTSLASNAAPQSSAPVASTAATSNDGSLVRERSRYRDPFGNRITAPISTARTQKEEVSGSSYGASQHNQDQSQINFPKTDLAHSKVAVIYFSVSENLESNDVDELTGASIIYNHKHERRGITEYVADLIAEATHAKIWWYELPMPLYTFFEQYDLSGKIVIPFCTHGGSRAYKTFALIAQQEPNAYVLYNDGLIIDRLVVPTHATSTVSLWLHALNERLSHRRSIPVGFDLDRHSPILEQNDVSGASPAGPATPPAAPSAPATPDAPAAPAPGSAQ